MPDEVDTNDALTAGRWVVAANATAVQACEAAMAEGFVHAVDLVARCTGKVVVSGSGTSGTIAARAAHLLSVAGTPSFALPAADGRHGGLGAIGCSDVVVAISKGGGSEELNAFCERAKGRARALIVITATERSPLTALADVAIVIPLPLEGDLGGVIATASSVAMATITDALAEAARRAKGVTWGDILGTHPSGAVGRNAAAALERLRGGPRG